MLIEFSVKNFLSFKNLVTLSMEKGNGDENSNNIISNEFGEFLKTAAIYGANASGKTNLLKAFTAAIIMVRSSNYIPLGAKWNLIKPFMFDEDSKNEPTEFEFVFISNNIKYKYYIQTDAEKVYKESLDAYYSQKPTNLFKRKDTNVYEFNSDRALLESIASKNTENKLFLVTAATWNYLKVKDAYLWFMNVIDTYDSFNTIFTKDIIDYKNDNELRNFTIKLLREADIHINNILVDYDLVSESKKDVYTIDNNPVLNNLNIQIEHEVLTDTNDVKKYNLSFNEESSGTKVLFTFAPYLKRAFENNRVIIVDEFEKSMHPALIEFIIKLFNNKKINKANSQLIITTHAPNLLNLELLRRDEIWFTEKNNKNGVSDLYPLDSFSVRKEENVQKGYLNGRYGAIPFIKDIDLWEE
ncbi:hypothetical protein EI71_01520 [Anaeroplasma bactoclasticum]|uniref:ATPase AAA-type core domain-containing protein n=1 Tax=Anaeroplasma bactoclasticum TaxID=2088 RepID=A0A397RYF9_9MOLU|nr:ATP-binding protein [Anaeroplasma bactoclasticum]RIA75431.1 hypothetical protein EI71_01520 [Anaeroplasma bactoclasticum]